MGVQDLEVSAEGVEQIVNVDTTLFSEETIVRACYRFTDRVWIAFERGVGPTLVLRIRQKGASTDLISIIDELGNELIDQRLRESIATETAAIRELIVAQAFAEAEFISKGEELPDVQAGRSSAGE